MNLLQNINQEIMELDSLLETVEDLLAHYYSWSIEQQKKFTIKEVLTQTPDESTDWDPESVKGYKGKGGIVRDVMTGRERGVQSRDIVLSVTDNKIKKIGVVLNIERGGANVSNPSTPDDWKSPIPVGQLKKADSQHPAIKKVMNKNPNRNVWVISTEDHWALPSS